MAIRLLSFAATHSRIAYAFFVGDRLTDWRISDRAAGSTEKAARWARKLVKELRPDVVVTEKPYPASKKGDNTKDLIDAIAVVATEHELLDAKVTREQAYRNKYEEAEAIAGWYPELKAWVPKKRRFFENEPRSIVVFEAMALALEILRDPAGRLGAAMG